jgi:hypothetical protein
MIPTHPNMIKHVHSYEVVIESIWSSSGRPNMFLAPLSNLRHPMDLLPGSWLWAVSRLIGFHPSSKIVCKWFLCLLTVCNHANYVLFSQIHTYIKVCVCVVSHTASRHSYKISHIPNHHIKSWSWIFHIIFALLNLPFIQYLTHIGYEYTHTLDTNGSLDRSVRNWVL